MFYVAPHSIECVNIAWIQYAENVLYSSQKCAQEKIKAIVIRIKLPLWTPLVNQCYINLILKKPSTDKYCKLLLEQFK